jgi:hypothetical protein
MPPPDSEGADKFFNEHYSPLVSRKQERDSILNPEARQS